MTASYKVLANYFYDLYIADQAFIHAIQILCIMLWINLLILWVLLCAKY